MFFAVLLLLVSTAAYAQDSAKGLDEAQCEKFLKKENIVPNLKLKTTTKLSGSLSDNNHVALKNWPMELRKWESRKHQPSVKFLKTDADGRFDFGLIGPGEYRLIAAPDRTWEQIQRIECLGSDECNLNLLLFPAEGELPEKDCPVQ